MADVPSLTAASPVSDDVELEDILRHSEVPAVVIRKDSSSVAASAAAADPRSDDADDAARLCTPAPMATFEMLSDVEESDMDDVTSLRDASVEESRVKPRVDDAASDDVDVQANGTVEPAPADVMDLTDTQNALDEHDESGLITQNITSRDTEDQSDFSATAAAGIPTLVFEDVDANNPTSLSSPECLVNNDNVNNDETEQQMWQWTTDHDQGNVLVQLSSAIDSLR